MQHISVPSNPILNGSVSALLTFLAAFNTTDIAAGVKVATIRADALNPVLLEFFAEVTVAFNAVTTNVLTVGSDITANQFLSAADITEGTLGFYPAAITRKRIVADTDIYLKYTQSGGVATTGSALIYLRVTPLAPSPSGYLR